MNAVAIEPTIITQTFYISTGAKNAMHTLRMRRDAPNLNPRFAPDHYIRNLAVDLETAQAKASEYFEAWKDRVGGDRADFHLVLELEPDTEIFKRRGRLSAADSYAIMDIEAGVLPFGKHKGTKIDAAPDSYILFFADKLKASEELNAVMSALAAACMGVAFEKGLIAKRDAARAERAAIDAKSDFIGTIGERRDFTGEVVTRFFKAPYAQEPEIGYFVTKIRVGDDLVSYIGNSLECAKGDVITFKATIKKHDEYQGVKTTQVNRPVMSKEK